MVTHKQKMLALAVDPTADGVCTVHEVRKWRKSLAGTVYHDKTSYMFIALDTGGHRAQFDYCHPPAERKRTGCNCKGDYEAMRAASRLWSNR